MGCQISAFLHVVEDWIQSARADFVSMTVQFFYQPQPENRLFAGMIKDMKFYQA